MFDWLTGKDRELEAHRGRRLDALVDSIGEPSHTVAVDVHSPERMQELERIYRALEKIYDARVEVLDRLQQNPARGMRGDYVFMSVQQVANAIRKMRENLISTNEEIREYELKIKRRTYNAFVEDEINRICATYKIEGLKTL